MPEATEPTPNATGDTRLYVPDHVDWEASIKHDWNKEYCSVQQPGDDFYHLLITGEIYLRRGTMKLCLSCAIRHGIATRERSFWLRRPSSVTEPLPTEYVGEQSADRVGDDTGNPLL